MRKLFAMFLAACLVGAIGITAFAAERIGQAGTKEIEVTAKYASATSTPAVYSVDLDWSSMIFTYTQHNIQSWNAGDHSYRLTSKGEWDNDTATITVTNHSNVAVKVKMTYAAVGGLGVKGKLTNASATLAAGEVGDYSQADSVTATLTISGTPSTEITADGTKIGTIKVSIS